MRIDEIREQLRQQWEHDNYGMPKELHQRIEAEYYYAHVYPTGDSFRAVFGCKFPNCHYIAEKTGFGTVDIAMAWCEKQAALIEKLTECNAALETVKDWGLQAPLSEMEAAEAAIEWNFPFGVIDEALEGLP